MMYDLYIEKQRADINQTLSIQLSYAIDDIRQWGTRNTSFSKSITLPGTAKNNKLFGHVLLSTTANNYAVNLPNVDLNFNPADISLCEVRQQGLLVLKGIFRLTGYKLNNGVYEYEGTIFGELGGFVSAIGNSRLEDLDFSQYNHTYNTTNILASWNTVNGSGYYYPLIDYGTYSTNKVDYDVKTLRPALYVKEYIDKIFANSGYTYESAFLETAFFKSFIIPNNTKTLSKISATALDVSTVTPQTFQDPTEEYRIDFDVETTLGSFNKLSDSTYEYTGVPSLNVRLRLTVTGGFYNSLAGNLKFFVLGKSSISEFYFPEKEDSSLQDFSETVTLDVTLETGDQVLMRFGVLSPDSQYWKVDIYSASLTATSFSQGPVEINVGETIPMNDMIPRGIFQKDLFTWILRMFDLYVDEDKLKEKHLVIEPYIDYYDYSNRLDWSQKIDYSKTLAFEPMGQLNGRFFEYKYKPDSDFYNESYQKRYNQSYGDILYDTGFPFSKDKQTIEIGFSPSVLVKYTGTDKVVSALYKKSSGNDVDQEERTETNIRILIAKKITGVASWKIKDGIADLSTQTVYGYGGHLDDPTTPTKDLNFGAPFEIFFTVDTYTGNGLFNVYWSSYINEITNKDSKILTCHAYLKSNDIADLDFSKPIYISGSLWRINKIEDYDAENPVTRVELLKIINADNG